MPRSRSESEDSTSSTSSNSSNSSKSSNKSEASHKSEGLGRDKGSNEKQYPSEPEEKETMINNNSKKFEIVSGGPTGGRTGGVYIPPFKLALMQKAAGKSSQENQRMSWEALRKSINGLINKVNVANIKHIIPEMFQENLIRGRGIFARAIMKAQLASPGFTHIYSALISIVNTKLPENGELILKRVIYGFKRAYKRRDKITATALSKFIAHLVNHQVAHEILALQLLTVLLEGRQNFIYFEI